MSETLDLGALVAEVSLTTVSFDKSYTRSVKQFRLLGAEAEQTAASVGTLDEAFAAAGKSASTATSGLTRVQRAEALTASTSTRAAVAEERHVAAVSELTAMMDRLAAESADVQRLALREAAAQDRLNAVTESGTATTRQLAGAKASLIGAQERLSTAQEEGAAATGRLTGAFGGTLKMAGELGLVIGGIEIARKAFEFISAGKDLQTSLNGVQAASRATDSQMSAVRAEAIGLGKDLTVPGATAVDAADAILDLVKAGIQLPKAMLAARPALLLASATQTGMADTARVLGDTLDLFGLSGEHAAHVADILAASSLGASHSLLGLFDELKQAGPTAQALGISLDDTAAALTLLAKHGISASMGGAGLKTMLTSLTKDTPKTQQALQDLGVSAFDAQGKFVGFPTLFGQLHSAQTRFGTDTKRFVGDLNAAFGVRAQSVAALFAKEGTGAYNAVLSRLESGDLQKYADDMNRGVSASFKQLSKQATAAGIDIYDGIEPKLNGALQLISHGIPLAIGIGAAGLAPLVSAWHVLDDVLGPVVDHLGGVISSLHVIAPELKITAGVVTAMYAAFKGYQLVMLAFDTIRFGVASARAAFTNGLADAQRYGVGTRTAVQGAADETEAAGAIMQAEFDQIGASALQSAATVDRAAAGQAVALADMAAASKSSSDEQIAAADAAAAAALAQAKASAIAAGQITAAADTSAAAVVADGEVAEAGWAGLAGPLGLAAVGVLTLVSLFHKSSDASKEATDAAKAYTTALASGGKSDLVDAIRTQLTNSKVPETIAALNTQLGHTAVSGKDFVTAIQSGGPALDTLRGKLEAVIKAGTVKGNARGNVSYLYDKNGVTAATKLLADLNTQQTALSKTVAKDLLDTKAYAGVSSSIDKTSVSTQVGSATAKQYAEMLGIVVDQNGVAAVSSAKLNAAVKTVATAYGDATQTGNDYLAAVNSFAQSGGTAADRAALIGATLKAANGDALNFAAQMNSAAAADRQLATDAKSAAKSVGKNGESTKAYLKSIVNLKTGTIDYSKAAAGPLISDLQSMQTAAMNAAEAQYQHAKATMSGRDAAAEAYKVYQSQTSGSLIAEAQQLGLTSGQAKKLADQYFGMPKSVKTLIEQQGGDPVLTVLNKIGALLANLTGQSWNLTVDANTSAAESKLEHLIALGNSTVANTGTLRGRLSRGAHGASAAGSRSWNSDGKLPPGWSTVGERGWELAKTDSSGRTEIVEHKQSMRETGLPDRLPGYAAGSGGPITTTTVGKDKKWVWDGQKYASLATAENARNRAEKSTRKARISAALGAAGSAVAGVNGQPGSPRFDPSSFSLGAFGQQIRHGLELIAKAQAAGVGSGKITGLLRQLMDEQRAGVAAERKLQAQIKGPELHNLTKSLTQGTSAVLAAEKALTATAKQAGLTHSQLNTLATKESALLVEERARVADENRLAAMKATRSSVESTLAGGFDLTKFGSVADLIAGEKTATGTNDKFAAAVKKLRAEGLNPKLLAQLIASGDTATLTTLAGASVGDIARENKAYAAYAGSLTSAGNSAVSAQYGKSVKAEEHELHKLTEHMDRVASAIAKYAANHAREQVSFELNGEKVGVGVFHSKAAGAFLAEIEHEIAKGHR